MLSRAALMNNERQMTFEEIDARAKELFGKQRPIEEWPFIDEGDRSYWRKIAAGRPCPPAKIDP
jgi:tRNA(Ile2) C34 agmatinyltransferase TiaS